MPPRARRAAREDRASARTSDDSPGCCRPIARRTSSLCAVTAMRLRTSEEPEVAAASARVVRTARIHTVVLLGLVAWRRDRTLSGFRRLLGIVVPRAALQRVEPFLVRFVDTLLALTRRPRVLLVAVAYTAVAVCLDALFCLLAFSAVGVRVAPAVVLYGYTFFNLAFILPTPPGQVGSNEFIGLLIFSGLFGLSRQGVGAMFLFSHPWTAVLMVTSGLVCLSVMGLTLRSALRLAGAEGEREVA